MVITIGRQSGSGGRMIGELLAKRLDTYSLGFGSSAYMDMPINHKIFLAQFETIKKIAEHEDCVIVGRCADYALNNYKNVVSVFISGDDEDKIKRLMSYTNITADKAKELMIKTDKKRAGYYNYYTSKRWGDTKSYDLCINSSRLGIEGSVDLILSYVDIKNKIRNTEK